MSQPKNMKRIKLCRIVYEFAPDTGGSITHAIDLAKHMAPYCERQFFIVPMNEKDTSEIDTGFPFEVYRVKYFRFKALQILRAKFGKWLPIWPLERMSFGFAALKKCIWINKNFGLDIIHIHGVDTAPLASFLRMITKCPIVLMLDGTLYSVSKRSGIYEDILLRFTNCDHLLVVDDGSSARTRFQKLRKSHKMTTVYHSIDTELFFPQKPKELDLKEINIRGSFIIMCMQALIPVKGVNYTISAFAEFTKQFADGDFKLLIIGDGPSRQVLEELSSNMGIQPKVVFLGGIAHSEIPKYLALASVFVASATYSNMVLSVEEAMACAKPVAAFDSGRTAELIIDGKTGLLARTGDAKDLAGKLLLLYNDPALRETLSANAHDFIIKNRTWEKRIDIELGVYRKLLKA